MSKFYTFIQNNSGGDFIIDDTFAHAMIIEADSANEANIKAEEIGIYFNGCSIGMDCSCCGDRWCSVDEGDADNNALVYSDSVGNYNCMWTPLGKAYAYVYYKNGTKESYIKEEKIYPTFAF